MITVLAFTLAAVFAGAGTVCLYRRHDIPAALCFVGAAITGVHGLGGIV